MSGRHLVTFILGTRPEAIKLAPIIIAFKACEMLRTRVVCTGQHRQLAAEILNLFELIPDVDLNLMTEKQSLTHITIEVLKGLKEEFQRNKPNLVIVQGDTTSSMAGALAAFYENIPVGHLEAGLRTNSLSEPFPEELNRRIISQIASLHFAPTDIAESNLRNSDALGEKYQTGNSVIDALEIIRRTSIIPKIKDIDWENKRVLLVTVHRRENWGKNLIDIAEGIKHILNSHKDVSALIPMHPNKMIREPLKEVLGGHPNACLIEPLNYNELIGVITKCKMVITDSGGLQEEAPALGKPVLVLRNSTERPEAIISGSAILVGTATNDIIENTNKLLNDPIIYKAMSTARNPFGDGKTSERVLNICCEKLVEWNKQNNSN